MSSVKLARLAKAPKSFVKPDSFCETNCDVRKYTLGRNARSRITAKRELCRGDCPVPMRPSGLKLPHIFSASLSSSLTLRSQQNGAPFSLAPGMNILRASIR